MRIDKLIWKTCKDSTIRWRLCCYPLQEIPSRWSCYLSYSDLVFLNLLNYLNGIVAQLCSRHKKVYSPQAIITGTWQSLKQKYYILVITCCWLLSIQQLIIILYFIYRYLRWTMRRTAPKRFSFNKVLFLRKIDD